MVDFFFNISLSTKICIIQKLIIFIYIFNFRLAVQPSYLPTKSQKRKFSAANKVIINIIFLKISWVMLLYSFYFKSSRKK